MRFVMKNALLLSFVTALTAGGEAAWADIYQYVDEQGVVHFTNTSGGGKHHRKVRAESPRPDNSPAQTPRPLSAPSGASNETYSEIINSACGKYGVDPSLVQAIVKVESDFNPFALSRKGAMGLMQLMPQTAMELNVRNSFSPRENIEGGVKHLRYLMDRYEGNLSLALAAYNSGENAVRQWGTIPPFKETQQYVKKILHLYNGTGKTFTPRYTIYVGHGEDGTLLLTDNPSNHPNKKLHRKMARSL
jgi:soluble lytic murein transglycosylase